MRTGEGELTAVQAEDAAERSWLSRAETALRSVAEAMQEFVVDDVWKAGKLETGAQHHDARALGSVMQRAARLGWIQKTNRLAPSARSNGSGKPVWKSLIYKGA